MKYSKLFILAAVLFFGTAYGQMTSESKLKTEEVIYINVDKEAVFSKGGDNGFRELLAIAIDTDKIDKYENYSEEEKKKIQKHNSKKESTPSVILFTKLAFVIEPDGTLSNMLAEGGNQSFNREVERAAKSIKTKWIPAEVKGKKVRYQHYMPIKMGFE